MVPAYRHTHLADYFLRKWSPSLLQEAIEARGHEFHEHPDLILRGGGGRVGE